MKRDIKAFFFLSLTLMMCPAVHADEGMWMLYNLPDAVYERMQGYGFTMSKDELVDRLSTCVVNFSGYCTGEVVSPNGLLMTNHHCGFEAVRSHSTTEHDYVLHGFMADSLSDELPCDGLFAAFMKNQEEVTDTLRALGIDTLSNFDRDLLIDSLEEAMTKRVKETDTTLYVEIDAFYEGNAYYATTYRMYDDIRLVMAPPKSLGKFGGERDNWMWPRQTCDFSVFRIYEDGKPLSTPLYIPVSTDGYKEGDFAMTIGYPGSTNRYLSSYGIEQMRDCLNDPIQQVRGVKQQVMKRHMDASEEVRIKYDSKYAQSSNYWKNAIGMNKCIDSIGLVKQKQEFERKLMKTDNSENSDYSEYSEYSENSDNSENSDLSTLKNLYLRQRKAMRAHTLFMETFTKRSNNELATRAYRYCNGMPVQGADKRLRKQYVQFTDNSDTYDRQLDIDVMAALLKNYREQITKLEDTQNIPSNPNTLSTPNNLNFLPSFYEIIDKDFYGDYHRYVEYLWNNSVLMTTKKIPMKLSKKLSRDPGIEFSMALLESLADIRLAIDSVKDSIQVMERRLCAAKIRMEQDQPHYSDANFTMRLSYGQVGGYRLGDYDSGYTTTPQSLLDKVTQYVNSQEDTTQTTNPYEEYFLEPEIIQIMQKSEYSDNSDYSEYSENSDKSDNTKKPFALCFLTNNDITGGNSGSPVVDGKGRLIGLAFDGTWDSLSSDIYFDNTLARCISVDIRYVLYIIKQWAKGERLLKEMMGEL